jgi:hypothetical protein
MDKLKEQLAVVKEHSFWILCGGILLFSLVSWYMSTNHLQEQQKKYKADIESAVGTLNQVRQTPDHPNESTIKGMDAVMQKFGEDVFQAWTHLAENQEQMLVWEGTFADERFLQEVRLLRPIETKVDESSTALNLENRRLYRDYIDEEIPKLANIILAKWQVDARSLGTGGMGAASEAGAGPPMGGGLAGPMGGLGPMGAGGMPGMGGGAGAAAKDDDPSVVVIWNPSNQKEITQMHFGMAMNNAPPSTLDVLYAQEDLWVFQNLMNIIKATNGDALRKHEAAIKVIEYVRIGRSAGDVAGQVRIAGANNTGGSSSMMQGGGMQGGMSPTGPGMGGAGGPSMTGGTGGGAGGAAAMMQGGMGAGMGGGPPSGSPAATPGAGGAAAGTTTTATTTIGSDRYVDLSYASIKDISRLRSAMKGTSTKPEDMLLAVAKRMPVRMQFKMDQRKLTTLLAECGNSKLPVEVRQVRINRSTASSMGGGGAMGAGGPGMGGGMMAGMSPGGAGGMGAPGASDGASGMAGMMGMGGAAGAGSRAASSIASSKEDPNEIGVEIYGIVYIYNPPERKLLGLSEPAVTAPPVGPVAPVPTPTSTTPEKARPPVTAGAAAGR